MRLTLFLVAVMFLASCSKSGSAISSQLSGSDSLVINFNKPQTNTIEKSVMTIEGKAIKKLSGFVDSKTAEAYKCGYDGNLMFYRQGILAGDVAFNYSGDGCHHFILSVGDKLNPTTMSNEAADFLKSLAEGKNWY
ncbi:MAG: hypothetical protein SGI83_03285 [Bacteroidota bacterium]|nr:hypothetical protein [Bacteroidota bacterium]